MPVPEGVDLETVRGQRHDRAGRRAKGAVGSRQFLAEQGIAPRRKWSGRSSGVGRRREDLVPWRRETAGYRRRRYAKRNHARAISGFKRLGLRVVMITGDNERTARAVARQVGIDDVVAQVLPQDKAIEVKRLQEAGDKVAFVGDGINDAPALAQADVGIAIGSGTDVAIESGEVVLIRDDLMDAVAGIELSRKVMARIKQNIFWAFAYNSALIPVASGVLYPFFGITMKPEWAGLAMAMSSVTVVTLSLMLKRYKPPAARNPNRE